MEARGLLGAELESQRGLVAATTRHEDWLLQQSLPQRHALHRASGHGILLAKDT